MTKSVRTTEAQDDYIERTNLNFSEWVRSQLDRKMEREHYGCCVICGKDVYINAGHDVSAGSPIGQVLGLTRQEAQDDGPLAACEDHYNRALALTGKDEAAEFPDEFVPDEWERIPQEDLTSLDPDGECTPQRQYTGTATTGEEMTVSLETYDDGNSWIVFTRLGSPDDDPKLYHNTKSSKSQVIGHMIEKLRHRGQQLPQIYLDS